MLRTIVSFEAADYSHERTNDDPPGEELAHFIGKSLSESGFKVVGPENREDWAWNISIKEEGFQIEIIIGFVDDKEIQWLITNHLHLSLARKIFKTNETKSAGTIYLRRLCDAIHKSLSSNNRVRSIRWYRQGDFDQNLTEEWASSPNL